MTAALKRSPAFSHLCDALTAEGPQVGVQLLTALGSLAEPTAAVALSHPGGQHRELQEFSMLSR
jgi:hypothetical protein